METQTNYPNPRGTARQSFVQRNALSVKIALIGALILLLLIRFYCITILYLQHELFRKSAIRQELDMLNHLWVQQKDQYDLAKENISLINRKCHDLKHQIQAMRLMFSDEKREDYLKEVEQSVLDVAYWDLIKNQNLSPTYKHVLP